MARKHPVFLCSDIPPNGGKKVCCLEDLINKTNFYDIPDNELLKSKIKRKVIIYPVVPRLFDDWSLQKTIEKYAPIGWEQHFFSAMNEIIFLDKLIETENNIFPKKKHVFRAFYLCPLHQVKVVIIGPEPFEKPDSTGTPLANGLCFSTNEKATKLHPSTVAIYRELKKSFPKFKTPKHGDFESWARQGVLFLNKALTLRSGAKKSHYNEWNGFFHRTLLYLRDSLPNVIFVLWGSEARSVREHIEGRHILEAPNPASYTGNNTFANCDHFIKINTILQTLGNQPIDWCDI